jgi:sucrose phosphorylase
MKNQVQLITYVDRLGGRRDGADLARLKRLLCEPGAPLHGVFGGVHLLPFFHAIDGADAGFDPIDHTQVDPRLGDWGDIKALTEDLDVMADVIVNHMSSESPQFLDYSRHGEASAYAGLFLTLDAVFPNGATERDLLAVYRPRPGLPLTYAALKNGERRILWTTFTAAQIDIAVRHPQGRAYLAGILKTFADNGIRMVRLDAVGYAIKKAGDSCFMMAETFDFIAEFAQQARALGIEVLVEIHAYYQRQIEIARQVDWVYDFALPPLVLHAFNFHTAAALKRWIAVRPTNALTVLDTHDGIGIIDIGADASDRAAHPGLVPPEELDALVERIHAASGGQSRLATGAAASNLDLYQVNCTFFDAMGRDETAYLLARAIQFFLPGRSTTSACWRATTTWTCSRRRRSAATSTATSTAKARSPVTASVRWCAGSSSSSSCATAIQPSAASSACSPAATPSCTCAGGKAPPGRRCASTSPASLTR